MNLESIMLSEISHTEKDIYDLTYMWNLKKNKKKREQKSSYQRWRIGGGGIGGRWSKGAKFQL